MSDWGKQPLDAKKVAMYVGGFLLVGIPLVWAFGKWEDSKKAAETVAVAAPKTLSAEAQAMLAKVEAAKEPDTVFAVQGDAGKYTVLYVADRSDGFLDVVTKREGNSGVSYTWRVVDCMQQRQQEVGSSMTELGQALEMRPVGKFEEDTKGSSAFFTIVAACESGQKGV